MMNLATNAPKLSIGSILDTHCKVYSANILDRCSVGRINALSFNYLSQTPSELFIFCRAFLSHPAIADEKKIEMAGLDSAKNWVEEINTTEYMQQEAGGFSQKNMSSPNCDHHGCYSYGSNK